MSWLNPYMLYVKVGLVVVVFLIIGSLWLRIKTEQLKTSKEREKTAEVQNQLTQCKGENEKFVMATAEQNRAIADLQRESAHLESLIGDMQVEEAKRTAALREALKKGGGAKTAAEFNRWLLAFYSQPF